MNESETTPEQDIEIAKVKLTKDLKLTAKSMDRDQAKILLRQYYRAQENRMRASKQSAGCEKRGQPHAVLDYFEEQNLAQEKEGVAVLACWAEDQPMAVWARKTAKGVGPILAAGLVAFIDIEKAPTVGHIWRFCGLDPTCKWEKGEKRPFCAALKTTTWKIWQSWLKLKNDPEAVYAQHFNTRRAYEWKRNLAGELKEQAEAQLKLKSWDKKSPSYAWLSGQVDQEWAASIVAAGEQFPLKPVLKADGAKPFPMLPPGHIQSRAGRWAVKLFLAHWHDEAYRQHFKTEPPKPYAIGILGHAHEIKAAA
jgi:hypothetical protein